MLKKDFDLETALFVEEIRLDNNHLFKKKKVKEEYRDIVRCKDCIYKDENYPNLPDGYIHCLKYPNMLARLDQTCKSGTKGTICQN